MNVDFQSSFPSSQLIIWLQTIFRERLCPKLILQFDFTISRWCLHLPATSFVIEFKYIPSFYKLGSYSDFPYCKIFIQGQGFGLQLSDLSAPGISAAPPTLVSHTDSGLFVDYDFPGLIFWMLCRCEEITFNRDFLDPFLRFQSSASHGYRHGYLDRPIVDEWFVFLRQILVSIWSDIKLTPQRSSIFITHDVDRPTAYGFIPKRQLFINMMSDFIKRKNLTLARRRLLLWSNSRNAISQSDPFNTFDFLMDASEGIGAKSTFYIKSGFTNVDFDSLYTLKDRSILELIEKIQDRGHYLGLHPSFECYNSSLNMNKESEKFYELCDLFNIDKTSCGARMHYLRWQWPLTAHLLSSNNFAYDSSLGFSDYVGFRCGTSFEYPLFNPISQKSIGIRERPLIVMDCALPPDISLNQQYTDKHLSSLLAILKKVKFVGGNFNILWHNSSFVAPGSQNFYLDLLYQCKHF